MTEARGVPQTVCVAAQLCLRLQTGPGATGLDLYLKPTRTATPMSGRCVDPPIRVCRELGSDRLYVRGWLSPTGQSSASRTRTAGE